MKCLCGFEGNHKEFLTILVNFSDPPFFTPTSTLAACPKCNTVQLVVEKKEIKKDDELIVNV
jgi:hypothetical protein